MSRLPLSILVVGLSISACSASAPRATPTNTVAPTSAAASQLPPQPHSTGACALTVKHVHIHEVFPGSEVATILEPPPGMPYRVRMTEDRAGTPVAYVNAFGMDWDGSVHVVETGPGLDGRGHTLGRRMEGISWATAFSQIGTYVIELSAPRNDCAATLVFEVGEG